MNGDLKILRPDFTHDPLKDAPSPDGPLTPQQQRKSDRLLDLTMRDWRGKSADVVPFRPDDKEGA